jgi:hypothetical protein
MKQGMKADRDASMEQLLASTLKSRATAANGGACLDAETLAAWADGALDARERATAEAHAADCSRCQELLAAMVRTLPPEAAKSPWRMPSLTWLVPLTAAATALAIWVAVPKPAPVQVSDGGAAAVDQVAPVVPSAERSARPFAPAASAPAAGAPAGRERPPEAERQLAKEKTAPSSATAPQKDRGRPENDLRDKQEAPVASTQQKAFERSEASNEARPAAAPLRADAASAATAADVAGAAPAAPPAQTQGGARRDALMAQTRATFPVMPVIVASSNPSTRFRLLPGGGVQRSADAGSTWRTESTGASATLTAGASPSPSVCWLVGQAGTVLLSTDGRTWRRIAFPEAVDLRSVEATDQETATVTTADGRAFVTTDGGQTWSRKQGF